MLFVFSGCFLSGYPGCYTENPSQAWILSSASDPGAPWLTDRERVGGHALTTSD